MSKVANLFRYIDTPTSLVQHISFKVMLIIICKLLK